MADTYEHDKPYLLDGKYVVNTQPTQLRASYDIHATFLGSPETELPITQYINGISFLATDMGSPKLMFTQYIQLTGSSYAAFTNPKIYNKLQKLAVTGFVNSAFGAAQIRNKNQAVVANGFVNTAFTKPYIYNIRQYISLTNRGFNNNVSGIAYVQGGVKYVNVSGFNSSAVAAPKLINTRADKYVNPTGIAAIVPPKPNVSPRIIYVPGIIAWGFGTAWVQRNPSPKGFTTDLYGTAWISHSPRYIQPAKVEAFISGYPKVFDPTQKIYVTGANTVITGGVFGDISAKNTRRIIKASGFYSQAFGDWGVVESTRRAIEIKGFDSKSFGITEVDQEI